MSSDEQDPPAAMDAGGEGFASETGGNESWDDDEGPPDLAPAPAPAPETSNVQETAEDVPANTEGRTEGDASDSDFDDDGPPPLLGAGARESGGEAFLDSVDDDDDDDDDDEPPPLDANAAAAVDRVGTVLGNGDAMEADGAEAADAGSGDEGPPALDARTEFGSTSPASHTALPYAANEVDSDADLEQELAGDREEFPAGPVDSDAPLAIGDGTDSDDDDEGPPPLLERSSMDAVPNDFYNEEEEAAGAGAGPGYEPGYEPEYEGDHPSYPGPDDDDNNAQYPDEGEGGGAQEYGGGPGYYDAQGEWFDAPDYDAGAAAAAAAGGIHHPGGYYADNDEWIYDMNYGIDYSAGVPAAVGVGVSTSGEAEAGGAEGHDPNLPGSPGVDLTATTQSAFTDDVHAADRAQRYCTMQDTALKQLMLNLDGASELNASLLHLSCGSGNVQALEEAIREGMLATGEMASHINGLDDGGRVPLVYAIIANSVPCAKLLIESGADVNAVDSEGQAIIHWASCQGKKAMVELVLAYGVDWRAQDPTGGTALHWACLNPNSGTHVVSRVMSHILAEGGSLEMTDAEGLTPLMWCAFHDRPKSLSALLVEGARTRSRDAEGSTSLHWCAAAPGATTAGQCAKPLLKNDPGLINEKDAEGRVPLHRAVAATNVKMVQLLLKAKGVDPNVTDSASRSALHWSCALGHAEIATILLDAGSKDSTADDHGATALHYAAQRGHNGCIDVLLGRADASDIVDSEGRPALIWAVMKGSLEVCKQLLDFAPTSASVADMHGRTALHAATFGNNPDIVALVLKQDGVDVDTADTAGRTALSNAVEGGYDTSAQHLLDAGANVTQADGEGRTVLHWACIQGNADLVAKFLTHKNTAMKPYLNLADERGETALHYSCFFGHLGIAKLIIAAGCDVNVQDIDGVTPLHWATVKGHPGLVELLVVEHGADTDIMEKTESRPTPLDYALQEAEAAGDAEITGQGPYQDCANILFAANALTSYELFTTAALTVQACWRGKQGRRLFEKVKAEKNKEVDAAKLIQATFRGHIQRTDFLKQKVAAMKIQRWARPGLNQWHGKRKAAATKIQAHYRGYNVRKTTKGPLYAKRKEMLDRMEKQRAIQREREYKASDAYRDKVARERNAAAQRRRSAVALKAVQDQQRRKAKKEADRKKYAAEKAAAEAANAKRARETARKKRELSAQKNLSESEVMQALQQRRVRQLARLDAAEASHIQETAEERLRRSGNRVEDRIFSAAKQGVRSFWDTHGPRAGNTRLERAGYAGGKHAANEAEHGGRGGSTAAVGAGAAAAASSGLSGRGGRKGLRGRGFDGTRLKGASATRGGGRMARLIARLAVPHKRALVSHPDLDEHPMLKLGGSLTRWGAVLPPTVLLPGEAKRKSVLLQEKKEARQARKEQEKLKDAKQDGAKEKRKQRIQAQLRNEAHFLMPPTLTRTPQLAAPRDRKPSLAYRIIELESAGVGGMVPPWAKSLQDRSSPSRSNWSGTSSDLAYIERLAEPKQPLPPVRT